MPNFEQGDVIKVPFPCTDRPARKFRPALVVSTGQLESRHDLLWVVMITSAQKKGWSGDVQILNFERAGLPVPSLVRTAKIATIEASHATRLGALSKTQSERVLRILQRNIEPGG